jgi:hypothetical protein
MQHSDGAPGATAVAGAVKPAERQLRCPPSDKSRPGAAGDGQELVATKRPVTISEGAAAKSANSLGLQMQEGPKLNRSA